MDDTPPPPDWASALPSPLREQARDAWADMHRKPGNAQASLKLAQALAANHPVAAAGLTKAAAEIALSDFLVQRNAAALLNGLGHAGDALPIGKRALALRPLDSTLQRLLGEIHLTLGLPHQAAVHLAQHVDMAGVTASGWHLMSVALHQLGETERALGASLRAMELDSSTDEYLVHYCGMLGVIGKFGDAIELLEAYVAKHPSSPIAWRCLSGNLEVTGKLEQALEAAQRSVILAPHDKALQAHRDHVAGLVDPVLSQEQTALEWAPRQGPRRTAMLLPRTSRSNQMMAWLRKIYYIMLWEAQTRFAGSKLGYFWALFEPLAHVGTIGVIFAFHSGGTPPIGDNLFTYYITGVCVYLTFARTADEVGNAVSAGRPMLRLPSIRPLDIIMARTSLSSATELTALAILLAVVGLVGFQAWPADFGTCLLAVLLAAGFGLGCGMINMVIMLYFHSWHQIWSIAVRFMYFISGIYYSPLSMPNYIRDILVLNPVLQFIEIFRHGFYNEYDPPWLDPYYAIQCVLFVVLLGIALQTLHLRRILATTAS